MTQAVGAARPWRRAESEGAYNETSVEAGSISIEHAAITEFDVIGDPTACAP